MVTIVGSILSATGIVAWRASRLETIVSSLNQTVAAIGKKLESLSDEDHSQDKRLTVVEDRLKIRMPLSNGKYPRVHRPDGE